MGLPWVRLDTNIWSHDKTVDLLSKPIGYKAFTLYICGLAYCGGHGTDGIISKGALKLISGTRATADALVDVGLWDHIEGGGYMIHNYSDRQIINWDTGATSQSARKSVCVRWMQKGKDCSCGEHLKP